MDVNEKLYYESPKYVVWIKNIGHVHCRARGQRFWTIIFACYALITQFGNIDIVSIALPKCWKDSTHANMKNKSYLISVKIPMLYDQSQDGSDAQYHWCTFISPGNDYSVIVSRPTIYFGLKGWIIMAGEFTFSAVTIYVRYSMFNTLNDNVDYKPNPNWCYIKSISRQSRLSVMSLVINDCIKYHFSRLIAFVSTSNCINIRSHSNSVSTCFQFINNQPVPGHLNTIKIN